MGPLAINLPAAEGDMRLVELHFHLLYLYETSPNPNTESALRQGIAGLQSGCTFYSNTCPSMSIVAPTANGASVTCTRRAPRLPLPSQRVRRAARATSRGSCRACSNSKA